MAPTNDKKMRGKVQSLQSQLAETATDSEFLPSASALYAHMRPLLLGGIRCEAD